MRAANGLWAALALLLLPGDSRALREGDCEGESAGTDGAALSGGSTDGWRERAAGPWPGGPSEHHRGWKLGPVLSRPPAPLPPLSPRPTSLSAKWASSWATAPASCEERSVLADPAVAT